MEHSVVSVVGVLISKVLIPINAAGSGRLAIPSMSVLPRVDYGTLRAHRGYIADQVTINGIGVRRRVCCLEAQSFRLFADTWSDQAGNYRFDNLSADTAYIVVSVDHENKYDPVGKAPLYPTRYA